MTTVIRPVYSGEMSCISQSTALQEWLDDKMRNMQFPSGNESWADVYAYIGTSRLPLLEQIPHLKLPCVVVWYQGSSWGNKPRREPRFSLMVCVKCLGGIDHFIAADAKCQNYVEDIADAIHRKIPTATNCECRVVDDVSVAVGQETTIAANEMTIRFRDQ